MKTVVISVVVTTTVFISALIIEPIVVDQLKRSDAFSDVECFAEDKKEWTTLALASPLQTSTSSSWYGLPLLKKGDQSDHVKELQISLQEANLYNGPIDGFFGQRTYEAVTVFQTQCGIQVDGLAGQHTYTRLANEASNPVSSSEDKNRSLSSAAVATDRLINDAKSLLGSPYVWGGTTPDGFDSSGFIHYVFRQNGIDLPRTHREYWDEGEPVSTPKRGDIVFFETYQPGPSHAGIYLGNNQFIHTSSSKGVIITSMDNPYWNPKYIGAKRYFQP
ncbi:NlpC/P60 family protein [Salipaludibacillus sp. LMS25]|uniref:C40 family peptidase n=1 Tax=Salipaludibacillus sp. LMS25 TaxID=2924031 RepID=UPI0020D102AF|nr:NlpC/P60 family protein [Salipaludibacillus sp. LMS25]UTR13220.1 NlpC/P60 family protein [Salipaludibacillus sp. LMS25]